MQNAHHTATAVGYTDLDSRDSAPEILVPGVWHTGGWCTGTATIIREIIANHVHNKNCMPYSTCLPSMNNIPLYRLLCVECREQTKLTAKDGAFLIWCSSTTRVQNTLWPTVQTQSQACTQQGFPFLPENRAFLLPAQESQEWNICAQPRGQSLDKN